MNINQTIRKLFLGEPPIEFAPLPSHPPVPAAIAGIDSRIEFIRASLGGNAESQAFTCGGISAGLMAWSDQRCLRPDDGELGDEREL